MKELNNPLKKKKIYWISFICIVTVLGIIIWFTNQSKLRFSIGDEKFRYVKKEQINDTKNIIFKDKKDNLVTVSIEEERHSTLFFTAKYTIHYLGKMITCDLPDISKGGRKVTLSDGNIYEQDIIELLSRDSTIGHPRTFDLQLIDGVERVLEFKETMRNSIGIFLLQSILVAMGLVGAVYPRELWKFQHSMSVANGEPTEFALDMNVVTGVFIILFALVMSFIVI